MSPSQREVDLFTDRKEVVAVVQFQHGDEVMRQKYQRSVVFIHRIIDVCDNRYLRNVIYLIQHMFLSFVT